MRERCIEKRKTNIFTFWWHFTILHIIQQQVPGLIHTYVPKYTQTKVFIFWPLPIWYWHLFSSPMHLCVVALFASVLSMHRFRSFYCFRIVSDIHWGLVRLPIDLQGVLSLRLLVLFFSQVWHGPLRTCVPAIVWPGVFVCGCCFPRHPTCLFARAPLLGWSGHTPEHWLVLGFEISTGRSRLLRLVGCWSSGWFQYLLCWPIRGDVEFLLGVVWPSLHCSKKKRKLLSCWRNRLLIGLHLFCLKQWWQWPQLFWFDWCHHPKKWEREKESRFTPCMLFVLHLYKTFYFYIHM